MKLYFAFAGATAIAITAGAIGLQSLTHGTPAPPFTPDSNEGVFLVVTDIHFDPFTDASIVPRLQEGQPTGTGHHSWEQIFAGGTQSWPRWRSDANYTLTRSALDTIHDLGMDYDYVLYTGDYLDHTFERQFGTIGESSKGTLEEFSVQTTAYINGQLEDVSSDAPVFGVIGNTDNACTDYVVRPNGAYLNDLSAPWDTLSGGSGTFTSFSLLGSYTVPHPTVADQEIIVLNNIFWSHKFEEDRGECLPTSQTPGESVLAWLEIQLHRLEHANKTAQILLHMPPGISGYDTANNITQRSSQRCEDWVEVYQTSYNERFIDLLNRHPGVVIQTFSGHSHMDSFTILPNTLLRGRSVVSHITPAVSPVFENNPSFALYLYDKVTGMVIDKAVYVLSNYDAVQAGTARTPNWELEYTFRDAYGAPNMAANTMYTVAHAIQSDIGVSNRYASYYTAGSSVPQISPRNNTYTAAFACTLNNPTVASYEACFCGTSD